MATPPNWISQMLGREVKLSPRKSPDEIPAARALWNLDHLNQNLPEMGRVNERVVLRTRKGVDLTAEVYVPPGKGPFPTLLYMHGGSWCLWSAAHVRKLSMRMAARGFVVVNLDYGLAPENPFPWAVEDAVYAARWVVRHIDRYQGIASKLVIGGDSAGANLASAAIVALASEPNSLGLDDPLSDTKVDITAALLLYGIFDFPLLFSKPGKNAGAGTIETTWNVAYLGPNFVSLHRNPLVSPTTWSDISKFPPAYLSCGARDALLPQTLEMARVLTDAEVPTTVSIVADADHGFLMMADQVPSAEQELQRIIGWLGDFAR
jgi:acetyl esterase